MVQQFDRSQYEDVEWNPLDPHQLENPYPLYARARQERPIFFSPTFGIWYVTRYEDIMQILRQPELFSSANSFMVTTEFAPEVEAVLAEGYPIVPTLVDNDPPSHTRFKKLVGKVFAPNRVREKADEIRELAHMLIDDFVDEGRADIAWQFAYLLPMYTIGDFLGVPREDMKMIKQWSDDWLLMMSGAAPTDELVGAAHSLVRFQNYFKDMLEDRRANPQDDYISALITVREEGEEPLADLEILCLALQLMFAGHETATNLINSTLWLLLHHPEQYAEVRDKPELAAEAIEEGLRLESPVPGLIRTVTQDTEFDGIFLPKGSRLQLMYASANRDAEKFEDPDTFDLHRANKYDHLALGKGIHYCVGAPLGKLESIIAIQALLERLPNMRLAADQTFEHQPSLVMRGLKNLIVEWDPPQA
ncbi:MAG: cytochrome P450 [Chloroflexi bacterium]|nr:cytochrome P450 [Chloroflexota bacterium]